MFSIVIPLYNKEHHITKTLNSVLEQTFKEFEIVVVDDGSTDNSINEVQKLSDPKIRLFSKTNGGVSHARNFGIRKSLNNYIAFLDADDSWDKNYLEEMYSLINKYPQAGMFNCSYIMAENNHDITQNTHLPEGLIKDYFRLSVESPVSWTSATIVKKAVFEQVGYFPEGMIGGEDVYMWTKIALEFPVAFTPKVLAKYNKNNESIIARAGRKDRCSESWSDFYTEDNDYLNQFIAQKAIMQGKRYSWGGFTRESREIEKQFKYVNKYKNVPHKWHTLYLLNRTPNFIKKLFLKLKQNIKQ